MATRIRRRRRRPHQTRWHKVAIPIVIVVGLIAAAGGVAAAWALNVYNEAPPLKDLKPVQKGRTSAIYTADGKLIGYIHSENVRQPISGDEIPQTAEKRHGLDRGQELLGTRRARLRRRSPAPPGRTPWPAASRSRAPRRSPSSWSATSTSATRKTRSSARSRSAPGGRALRSAQPQWILNTYLNTAPYGTNDGQTALGVEAAAQTYFDKPAKELNLTESALIAGLPQAPSEYNPFLDPKAALQRRNEVLGTMYEQGYITRDRYLKARTSGPRPATRATATRPSTTSSSSTWSNRN